MATELLQQVRLIDPVAQTDRLVDVLIGDGSILAIEETINDSPADVQIRDCSGLILGPGLVDLYSHSGEPGFEERETLMSLLQAAAAGGFTRLTLLPDTRPAIDNPSSVEWFRSRLQTNAATHLAASDEQSWIASTPAQQPKLHYWGALTVGAEGEQMVDLAELAAAGIVGFADGRPIANAALLRRLLEYGQILGKPIALYCCDRHLTADGVVREGVEALRLGLPGSPVIAETLPLSALLEYVAYLGTPVHIMRVSTARGVELIRSAKAQGLPITASTTWMHLVLNITAVQSYHPSLRLDPPLGTPADQAALIHGLQEGVIDAIAIDHTPLTYEEKTVAFAEAPPGAIGLELALPLLWQTFVESGRWSAVSLWQFLSTNAVRCLQQSSAAIQPGQRAELILFDPKIAWTVSAQTLHSRSINTPWLEQTILGRVVKIWG